MHHRVMSLSLMFAFSLSACTPDPPSVAPQNSASSERHYRLFFLSDVKGELEPCGCTLEPLGGLARLASYLKQRQAKQVVPMVITHGNLRAKGSVSPGAAPQVQASALFLQSQLMELGLQAAGDGPHDRALGALFERLRTTPRFPHVEAGNIHLVKGIQWLRSGKKPGRAIDADKPAVMLFDGTPEEARQQAKSLTALGVDLLLLARGGDGISLLDVGHGLFAVQGGERGQHVVEINLIWRGAGSLIRHRGAAARATELQAMQTRIDGLIAQRDRAKIRRKPKALFDARQAQVARAKAQRKTLLDSPLPEPPKQGNVLMVARVPLDSSIAEEKAMAERVQAHHRSISALNKRLEPTRACPPPPAKDQAVYIGSKRCQACHPKAYQFWQGTDHAHAWKTLVTRGRNYDYGCVECHSAGFDVPEGFCRVSEAGDRVNVGCESCHGAGSKHAASGAKNAIQRAVPETQCTSCHHPPHTNTFVYADRLKRILGPGHGAP